jgi:hypothetical protein
MKNFLKKYWPFFPLILVVSAAFLLIAIAIVGDLYGYWSISRYDNDYQSDGLYDNSNDSLRN